jgi:two-component system, chemotaxis family, chemotaxis protein CheY
LVIQERVSVSKCILIVDDNELVRRTVRRFLEEDGWKVCGEGVNGRDGIEKARELNPDLILLDLAMPEMDGFQAARVLKRLLPRIPLLLFTTFGLDQFLRREAAAAGITDVIAKSEAPHVLLRSVRAALQAA